MKRIPLRTAAWFAGGLFALSSLGIFLYVLPTTEGPLDSDVLVVLAPSHDRIPFAEQLMDDGYARTLVISAPVNDATTRPPICTQKREYRIICFAPDPITTQGEARALRTLSEKHEWNSANVLTAQFHVTRARIILGRCYTGDLKMIAFKQPMPLLSPELDGSWAYHFAYESAAFVKVALNPDC